MIAMSWTTTAGPPDPGAACEVLAARLPLRSRRDIPAFLRAALPVRRQLTRRPD